MTGRALTVVLGTVLVLSHTICFANEPPGLSPQSDLTLAEQVNDPTAKLTQFQIKNIYTPAEYDTNAQPNTVQIRPIISIEPFWIFPLPQILRPTIRVVTVPTGKGASTTTAYVLPQPGMLLRDNRRSFSLGGGARGGAAPPRHSV